MYFTVLLKLKTIRDVDEKKQDHLSAQAGCDPVWFAGAAIHWYGLYDEHASMHPFIQLIKLT